MTKTVRRIATFCIIGTVSFAGQSIIANAEELPVAGIGVILNDFYQNTSDTNVDIIDYLSMESEYADMAIASVTDYVNIRSKANEESKILGKLYNNSAATILKEKGDWYKIESGTVTGYIKAEYLVTGEKVDELALKVGERIATVNTTTLKVREKASLDAPVQTLVPAGEELNVVKELDNWVKVTIDADVVGYVSTDYVDLRTEFEEAESKKEEEARLAEEAARLAEEARIADEANRANEAASNSSSRSNSRTQSRSTSRTQSRSTSRTQSRSKAVTKSNNSSSSKRNQIVNYALRFVGNPYVWGGTSLTNGADCSGYTQSVFSDMGIRIPRDSRSQASGGGRTISINNVQPGDLIFYDRNGTINHVAIYIGNGKVVNASSPKTGIRISNYNYRQPVKVVNYID